MAINLKEFLLAVNQHGGTATTTDIRSELGLTSSQVHYRVEKAKEQGYIETMQPSSDTGRPEPKVATLTEEGNDWLSMRSAKTEMDDETITVSRSEIENLHKRIDELECRLNAQNELVQKIRKVINHLIPYVKEFRSMVNSNYFHDWDDDLD